MQKIAVGLGALLFFSACSKDENLTLRNEQFGLNQVSNSGVSGTVFVAENQDHSFNITVRLNNSVKDTIHIMNVYKTPGQVAVKLADIKGTGSAAIGETKNIAQAVEVTGNFGSVNYDQVIAQKNIVRVLMSASNNLVLCEGEIGR